MYLKGQGVPRDFAQARMWFNLSAFRAEDARTRELASKFRDLFVARMTPTQVAEAWQKAGEWVPKK
jgi:TPR repeat protein